MYNKNAFANIKVDKNYDNLLLPIPIYLVSIAILFILFLANFIMLLLCYLEANENIFIPGSTFLTKDNKELINSWINPKGKINITLLYKASKHGEISEMFHFKCAGQGAVLVATLLDNGCIFGGYTSKGFDWDDTGYQKDENAFLFNINYKEKYPVKEPTKAIFNSPYKGPVFGYPDLEIGDLCLTLKSSFVIPNSSYDSPLNYSLSCGNKKFFKVKDYEVYSINNII